VRATICGGGGAGSAADSLTGISSGGGAGGCLVDLVVKDLLYPVVAFAGSGAAPNELTGETSYAIINAVTYSGYGGATGVSGAVSGHGGGGGGSSASGSTVSASGGAGASQGGNGGVLSDSLLETHDGGSGQLFSKYYSGAGGGIAIGNGGIPFDGDAITAGLGSDCGTEQAGGGGASYLGAGGNGNCDGNGLPGSNYGGGGGGAGLASSGFTGGAGGDGIVILTFFRP